MTDLQLPIPSPLAPSPNGAAGSTGVAGRDEAGIPRWVRDLWRFLPLRSQFILWGNTRDLFLHRDKEGKLHRPQLVSYLAGVLAARGITRVLAYDTVHGFQPVAAPGHDTKEMQALFAAEPFSLNFQPLEQEGRGRTGDALALRDPAGGNAYCTLDAAFAVIERVVRYEQGGVAVIADFASRYAARATHLQQGENAFFTQMLKLSHAARTWPAPGGAQYNPVLWICDGETDLPAWLALNNPRLRSIVLSRPDHEQRRAMAEVYVPSVFPTVSTYAPDEREQHLAQLVEQTEGMQLVDVAGILQLCGREEVPLHEISAAVRMYKLGVTEDRWRRLPPEVIAEGEERIGRTVKGQRHAVRKALDIVKRAKTGLAGAQSGSANSRPRGVLFLAGPTGVGKTELAKALTKLLFGDERAYIRFDMSEFSEAHASARLLGAPPGYVGYESGGELVNAVRERPASVILFDEIEKAHRQLFDKFLQLLDEGVLTSGRGERVYFSDCIIVFTSNLGIHQANADGHVEQQVDPARHDRAAVEARVRSAIQRFFDLELRRPEILNRIGENIVVFDFIRRQPGEPACVATQILDMMLRGVLVRVRQQNDVIIELAPAAHAALLERCTADLRHGGRGIGNQLELHFINPLARELFDRGVPSGAHVTVHDIGSDDHGPTLSLEVR